MTMDFSLVMACAVINIVHNDSRSALPGAPTVAVRPARRARLARPRGWLATVLHQAAWAIEPKLQPVMES